jgi:hypothetical protein
MMSACNVSSNHNSQAGIDVPPLVDSTKANPNQNNEASKEAEEADVINNEEGTFEEEISKEETFREEAPKEAVKEDAAEEGAVKEDNQEEGSKEDQTSSLQDENKINDDKNETTEINNSPEAEDNTGVNDSEVNDNIEEEVSPEADFNQDENITFMSVNKENVPINDINVDAFKTVEALDTTMTTNRIPVSPDNPLAIETTVSEYSMPADSSNIYNYREEKFNVFNNTYDCVDGCWKFTGTEQRGFYFYSINDDYFFKNDPTLPKMKRCFLINNNFYMEYLDTEDRFYAPYEDEEGNIYAECGKYTAGGYSENPDLYISKMDQDGRTLAKIHINDLHDKGLNYAGFTFIKKDIIAVIFKSSMDNSELATQLQIIDVKNEKMINIINLEDEVSLNIKSDGDYFVLISNSYQRVYVFDADTYELVNTVDTTKCKELCVYEWKVNDWDVGGYSNLSYELDIKDGQLYFLRHSGIYVTDCMKSAFYKQLDGSLFADFRNQLNKYTSFYVGKDNDFFILGVNVDEESATTMWHYTKTD